MSLSGDPTSSAAAPLHVVLQGEGPRVLLVHGSAADHTTWLSQLTALRGQCRMIAPDRRGCGASPLPEGRPPLSVEEHAEDLAQVLQTHAGGEPVVACGSSFGAVAVLELARRRPELLRGALLIEPPVAPSDDVPAVPPDFLERFDQLAATESGEKAAELFLRAVLGDDAFERLPRSVRARTTGAWRSIRRDCGALAHYRVGYERLGEVRTPVLLLGGERSGAFYRPALEALRRGLGRARLELVPGAGHMLHAEVYSRFNARLLGFLEELAPRAAP